VKKMEMMMMMMNKSSKQIFSNLRIYQIKLLRFVLLSYYSLYFFFSSFVMVNKGLKKNKTMDCNFFINFLIDFRAKKKKGESMHIQYHTPWLILGWIMHRH
jgi:hypothetical protein